MSETATYRNELLARLRSVSDDIRWAVRGLNAAQLGYKPADDEWSIHENLSHLRDMEQRVYLPLLRWATVPDMLDPANYNRKQWAAERHDRDEPVPSLLDDIDRIRDEQFEVFRTMDDKVWLRLREDTRWGPLTCQWIAEVTYRHALDHLQAIMGLRQDIHLAELQPATTGKGPQS